MIKTVGFVAVLAFVSATALPTSSQRGESGPYLVFRWLEEAGAALQEEGYRPLSRPEGGILRPSQSTSQRLVLRTGMEYQIIGMCDDNCVDLNLSLYNSSGELLSTDSAPDDLPLLAYSPPVTGEYRVRISMRQCREQACFFGTYVLVR